jgi:ABC-type lipoprotein release transport system permease subunit
MSGGLLQLAWRNLWRNRRRTFITMAAIAFGYAMLLFVACLMAGLRWQMIQNGTCLVMSQIQVHAPGYYPNRSLEKTLGGRQGTNVSALPIDPLEWRSWESTLIRNPRSPHSIPR